MSKHLEEQIESRQKAIERLDSEISFVKQRLEKLQQERMVTTAELRAYQDAMAHLPTVSRSRRSSRGTNGGLKRALSESWTYILRKMGERHPRTTTNNEIIEIAASGGYPIERDNVRSQMSLYTQKKLVERVRPGEYRLTKLGAKEVGVTLNEEAPDDASGASSNLGEAGSPEGPSKAAPTGSTPVSSTDRPPWESDDDEIPF